MRCSMAYRRPRTRSIVLALIFALLLLFASIVVYINIYKPTPNPIPTPKPLTGIAYGVNVDITSMVPNTPYSVKTASGGNFFDLATQLGINTLRITDVRWAISGEEYSRETWNTVFSEASQHHINIIMLLVDGGKHSALEEAHMLLSEYGLALSP